MKKLLITGGSGFLGFNLCTIAKNSWDVYCTAFSHAADVPGCTVLPVNLTVYSQVKKLFKQVQPDAVIHTAAQSQPNVCQSSPQEAYNINVRATIALAGLCADRAIPFVFTSTDLVFDGKHAPYSEKDPVSPVNIYGEQKAIAELEINKCHPGPAICRMPLMFGDPSPGSGGFLQSILQNLQRRNPVYLFVDEYRTPVSAQTAAAGLLLVTDSFSGIIHLGGRERIARYEFGIKVAGYCGFDKSLIKPLSQKDLPAPAPRPPDVSLNSAKAFKMGYAPSLLLEEFEKLSCLKKSGSNGMA